jgi:hypothetical protein
MRHMLVVFAVLALTPGGALAQSGGSYRLDWSTLDGGGGMASLGGTYVLSGTSGQPDAGSMTGGLYQLRGGFWHSGSGVVGVGGGDEPPVGPLEAPAAFRVHPIRPNPSAGAATLGFDLPGDAAVEVELFGLRGERVRSLLSGVRPAGRHQVRWDGAADDGRPVPDGVYFARVRAGAWSDVVKMVVAR